MGTFKSNLLPVRVFAKISIRRAFRDKTAIFFIFLFPLIFLLVLGTIFGKNGDVSFRVALINESSTTLAGQYVDGLGKNKVFKIDTEANSLDAAREKMARGQLDAAIIVPKNFGAESQSGKPSGQVKVYYTQNNQQAAQTLGAILDAGLQGVNKQFVSVETPFKVETEQLNGRSLSQFDYTFAGLLGFSIIGLGIFGPVNIFPELKKQGILKRLHTTPLRVWQFFLANVISQAAVGLVSVSLMFAAAILFFNLNLVGNIAELALFVVLGITLILGIGLAMGGWAKNERQAAPLSNLVVFPMLFLSGTFFPRFLMPEWLQNISNFLPLTPVIDGIRLIATEGKHLLDLGPQLGLMAVWFVVIYIIAFRVFRWE